MTGDIWSEAMRVVQASEPSIQTLDTLELRHSAFDAPQRFVLDNADWTLTLETGAPVNGGEAVLFSAIAMEIELPASEENKLPSMQLIVDNVSKTLMPQLDAAVAVREPIELTWREYLSTDPTTVQAIISGMTIRVTDSNQLRITADAGFFDLQNMSFPRVLFTPDAFAGLT